MLASCLRAWLSTLAIFAAQAADFSQIGPELERLAREEMRAWEISGIAIALVDDQQIVYIAGYGDASRDSLFRVGSISKLFNAVAVMQQVEDGKLDLDTPVPREYLPLIPFDEAAPVTLRQLLCHRSGLPRETPVGGYFDDSQPGLERTVSSLTSCVLVTRPGEKMRYSNIGPSLAGRLVEIAAGQSFEEYQRARILTPLGITGASWTLNQAVRKRLVVSHMCVADGRGGWRRQESPVFDLGTIPAGNLFASAEDLARFASALLAEGKGILKRQSLEEMWRPQFTDEPGGFGLGFMVGKFEGRRTVGHSGAVYGHSTSLVLLPEEKLAAVVLANEDIVNGRVRRISNRALSLLLAAKLQTPPPASETQVPFEVEDIARFTGDYESQSYWAKLEVKDGKLEGFVSSQFTRFTPHARNKFAADSRLEDATPAVFEENTAGAITGFKLAGQIFRRAPTDAVRLPSEWRAFLGSYGPDFIPVWVTERYGHLYAMTENMVDYRLTPINRNVCGLPPGMYVDEHVVFFTDSAGRAIGMNYANMIFRRNEPSR